MSERRWTLAEIKSAYEDGFGMFLDVGDKHLAEIFKILSVMPESKDLAVKDMTESESAAETYDRYSGDEIEERLEWLKATYTDWTVGSSAKRIAELEAENAELRAKLDGV